MAPLTGVKVIEAANFIAGPMAGMILADLGAEVLKVEPPRGDPYRRVGVPYGDSSLQFKATNQNKRSVAIDLKSTDGIERFHELLVDADILLTNWRPGVAERMGLTADGIRERYPNLIWVRVSGYGPDGPRSAEPAYDIIIQARSGSQLSGADVPFNVNSNVADKVSAMFGAHAIMAALHQRTREGTGSVVDVAMIDAMAYFYGTDISAGHRMADREPDLAVAANAAVDLSLETGDGYLALSPVTGSQVRAAMEAAGVGDRFGDVMSAHRSKTMATFLEIVGPALMERSALEWEDIFKEADVPAAAIRRFDEHLVDPQTEHLGTYERVHDPSIDGDWLLVGFPARFDGERPETAKLPAPLLPEADDTA